MTIALERPLRRRGQAVLGLVEALATPHGIDRYLELVNPMLTVRELRARVTAVHRQTPDTVTLTLRPTRQWHGFRAGQFVRLTVVIDGVRRTRCYSPACSASKPDGSIELTVKAHPGGLVSGYLNREARPGLVVGLSQAGGAFTLPDPRPASVLFVSGGSGITPVLSMLRTLCDEGYDGDVTFLHYGYRPEDVAYRDDLVALAAAHSNVRVAFGYTETGGGDVTGLFELEHLAAVAPWYRDADTFLCGPGPLMRAVREAYEDAGLSERLHTEEFAPAPVVADAADATGSVTFARSDTAVDNSGRTLLEQAEAAGLDPEHGCRMGICFSCTQVKTSGCVRNVLTGDVSSDPEEEIQLCISVPVGDVAIDL
jgi:ferredoxin-NADP reductase